MLCGGRGRRLAPVTSIINKHILPIYDKPMIYYPLKTLRDIGIYEIVLVTGDQIVQFKQLLGDGDSLGVSIQYAYQDGEKGIADALAKAEPYIDEPVVVILGDNIFDENLRKYFTKLKEPGRLLLKEVSVEEARRCGVAVLADNKLIEIEEKPVNPSSNLVVTGCYYYPSTVFSLIKELTPSARGELEITDLNNLLLKEVGLDYATIKGYWADCGTYESKLKASVHVAQKNGLIMAD